MKIKFEPRDIWVGLYWKKTEDTKYSMDRTRKFFLWYVEFYLCIIPCFPIWWRIQTNKGLEEVSDA